MDSKELKQLKREIISRWDRYGMYSAIYARGGRLHREDVCTPRQAVDDGALVAVATGDVKIPDLRSFLECAA